MTSDHFCAFMKARQATSGAKPSFVPEPHVVMKQPPAHQPASPKIGFLQPERGTNHDRMYLRGRLALRAISTVARHSG
jgi:hypothetical protein